MYPTTRNKQAGTIAPLIFFLILAGVGLSYGQAAKADDTKDAAAEEKSPPDARVRSATALGDVIFKSRNSFVFSVSAEETFQSNLFFSEEANQQSDTFSNISSRIAYQREKPRSTIAFDYALGSRIYHGYDSYNQLTHIGGLNLNYRLTPRLSFYIGDRVTVTPESSGIFQKDLVVEAPPNDIAPNTSIFLRWNRTLINTAFTGFFYELSRRSQLTLGAHSSMSRFDQSNLMDENRRGANIRYSYKLAERTTLGLGYTFNYFDLVDSQPIGLAASFTSSSKVARNHLAYVGIQQRLTPFVSVSVDVGPSVTVGDAVGTGAFQLYPGVRPSVGARILFSQPIDPRTFFSFDVRQLPSDGSGLAIYAESQIAEASLGRLVSKTITAAVSVAYSRNRFPASFDSSGQPVTTNGIIVGSDLRVRLTDRLSLTASYSLFRQVSTGFFDVIPANLSGHSVRVGLSYAIPVFFSSPRPGR